jgi:tetratricopeptide (TPR) repeat protein
MDSKSGRTNTTLDTGILLSFNFNPMKRINEIVRSWDADKEIKTGLLEKINRLLSIDLIENAEPSYHLDEIKKIYAFVKANFNLDQLIEFSLIFSNQLLIGRKTKEAEYVLNALLAEEVTNAIEAEIFLLIADISIRECRWDECLRLLSEAKIIFEKLSDNIGRAKVENLWGIFHGERGEVDLAKDHFKSGLSLLKSGENLELSAELESNLAITEIICHNFTTAEISLKNGLNAFPDSEDNRWLAEMIHNYGMLHLHKKNYRQAIEDFDGAIDLSSENNHLEVLTLSKGAKALALIYLDRVEEGLILAEKSLMLAQKINDRLTMADDYKIIGVGERTRENYKKSEEYLRKSYELNMKLNNNLNAAEAAFELAILFRQTLDEEKSRNWYKISVNYFEKIGAKNRLKSMEETINSI